MVRAGHTIVLFEHNAGPGRAELTVHLPAPAAGKKVIGTDRAITGRAVEKTVRANKVRAQAAAQLDVVTAEGLFTDPAANGMISAEQSAADRTPHIL